MDSPFLDLFLKTQTQQNAKIYASSKRRLVLVSSKSLYPLWATGVCAVPLPIRISPLASALYLTLGKLVKANNVKKIEYYENPSVLKSMAKMMPGVLIEETTICATLYIWMYIWRSILNFDNK